MISTYTMINPVDYHCIKLSLIIHKQLFFLDLSKKQI